jgi:hypothetical protein
MARPATQAKFLSWFDYIPIGKKAAAVLTEKSCCKMPSDVFMVGEDLKNNRPVLGGYSKQSFRVAAICLRAPA